MAQASTKVAAPSSKPNIATKSQPIVGKLTGMSAMPGSKGKGQAVKTVPSNPIQGKNVQPGNTAMGSSGMLNGFV